MNNTRLLCIISTILLISSILSPFTIYIKHLSHESIDMDQTRDQGPTSHVPINSDINLQQIVDGKILML